MSLENDLEKNLKIKTTGRDDSNSDLTNYPYEATSYEILRELAYSGFINKNDTLVDFGSGKGRVGFYLSYYTKAKTIGIEYDLRLYNRALDNHNTSISSSRVSFVNCCASTFKFTDDITCCYFFNPFSIFILKQVIDNVRVCKKEINLFFYYPSKDYLTYLDNEIDIIHVEDIDCTNLFKKDDKREFIAVYKII